MVGTGTASVEEVEDGCTVNVSRGNCWLQGKTQLLRNTVDVESTLGTILPYPGRYDRRQERSVFLVRRNSE